MGFEALLGAHTKLPTRACTELSPPHVQHTLYESSDRETLHASQGGVRGDGAEEGGGGRTCWQGRVPSSQTASDTQAAPWLDTPLQPGSSHRGTNPFPRHCCSRARERSRRSRRFRRPAAETRALGRERSAIPIISRVSEARFPSSLARCRMARTVASAMQTIQPRPGVRAQPSQGETG